MRVVAIMSVLLLAACASYTPPPKSTPTAKIRFVAEDDEIGVLVSLKNKAKCNWYGTREVVSRLRKTPSWLGEGYDNRMDLKMPLGDTIPADLKTEFNIPANKKIAFSFGLGSSPVCNPQFTFTPNVNHLYEAIYKLHGSGWGAYCTVELFEIQKGSDGYYRKRMENGDSELEMCKRPGS